jgi:hypothetical protein
MNYRSNPLRRRYKHNEDFVLFLKKYNLPAAKIAEICGIKPYSLWAIQCGFQRDTKEIREKIRQGMISYAKKIVKQKH